MLRKVPEAFTTGSDQHNAQKAWLNGYDAAIRANNDIAARLDRLCQSVEKGASWESAAHLRNRTMSALRQIAREITREESCQTSNSVN